MTPNLIIAAVLTAFVGGSLFYSYHQGLTHGEKICEAEKLTRELEQSRLDLSVTKELNNLQVIQISEAQQALEESKNEADNLHKQLDNLNLIGQSECIPDSMLDSIRKFRSRTKG